MNEADRIWGKLDEEGLVYEPDQTLSKRNFHHTVPIILKESSPAIKREVLQKLKVFLCCFPPEKKADLGQKMFEEITRQLQALPEPPKDLEPTPPNKEG